MTQTPKFLLTLKSNNHKTGNMPVSTSPMNTCPSTCPFRERGCYANYGPVKLWWQKCTDAPGDLRTEYMRFLYRVEHEIKPGQTWRHNQGGDLVPWTDEMIDKGSAIKLTFANGGKKGFTYTHFGVIEQKGTSTESARHNRAIVERMNELGFIVNVSCNSIAHADRVKASGIKAPIATMVPESYGKEKHTKTPGGNKILVCPNVTRGTTCTECGLCMRQRDVIIAFPAHGSGRKRAEEVYTEWSTGDYVAPDAEAQAKLDKDAIKRAKIIEKARARRAAKKEKEATKVKIEMSQEAAKLLLAFIEMSQDDAKHLLAFIDPADKSNKWSATKSMIDDLKATLNEKIAME